MEHPVIHRSSFEATDFISGIIGGIAFTLASQPMDFIKTHIQMVGRRLTLNDIVQLIKKQVGLNMLAFYRGASTMFLSNSLSNSIELGLNETLHNFFRNSINKDGQILLPLYQVALCGTLTGAVTSLICTPTEFCKIQMQMTSSPYQKYKSAFHILVRKVADGDSKTLFKGGVSCLMRESIGGILYFVVYESYLRSRFVPGQKSYSESSMKDILTAGALAGLNIVPVYPLDMIKTQIQSGVCNTYKESINLIWKNKSVFTGLFATVLRTLPGSAFTFLAFQQSQRFFKVWKY